MPPVLSREFSQSETRQQDAFCLPAAREARLITDRIKIPPTTPRETPMGIL